MRISFVVYAHPEPQGSTRAFIPKGWKRPIITSTNKKLKSFRQEVAKAAIEAMSGSEIMGRERAVALIVTYFFNRPKSAKKSRVYPTVKPDLDKCDRSIFDALTGICYEDDSQIVACTSQKLYGSPERVEIVVEGAYGIS